MEIRGTAWATGAAGDPKRLLAFESINNLEDYMNPLEAIKSAEVNLIEHLTEKGAVQNPIISYSMSAPVFDYLIKDVKEKALKKGREETWDLARRIVTCGPDCYTGSDFNSVFGSCNTTSIFEMPADEALAKDKKHQEDKNTLHIGDEVKFTTGGSTVNGYIVNLALPAFVRVLTKKYGTCSVSPGKCKKTGRHSDEIEKVMASFEEGE